MFYFVTISTPIWQRESWTSVTLLCYPQTNAQVVEYFRQIVQLDMMLLQVSSVLPECRVLLAVAFLSSQAYSTILASTLLLVAAFLWTVHDVDT